MLRVFPQLTDVAVDYAWGGLVGISTSGMPQLGRSSATIWHAHGYSGHGVAQSHMAGRLLGAAIAGERADFDCLAAVRGPRLPLPRMLGPLALGAGFGIGWLRDRLGL